MRKVIFVWIMILGVIFFCWNNSWAELYMVIDKNTKEVYTIGEKLDSMLSPNQEVVVLSGTWENYEFSHNPTYYKYKGNKFVLNTDKINAEEQEKVKQAEINAEVELVRNKYADDYIAKLESEGVQFKHKAEVKEKLKKGRADVGM